MRINVRYEIIGGKVLAILLLLLLPYYVTIFTHEKGTFYETLFILNTGIFSLRMGQEYYLFSGEDQTDYLAARGSLKLLFLVFTLILMREYVILFLLMNWGSEMSFKVIRYRITGRFGIWPYLFEGIIPLLMAIIYFIPFLSYFLAVVSIFEMLRGSFSLNLRPLSSGLGTMSNTIVSLIVSNVLPLVLLIDMESFYVYSRATGIVGMSSTYGNLLYQKADNSSSIETIRKISLFQLPVFLVFGVIYVVINGRELVWTFFIAAIVNVLTGPIQIDLLRMKKSRKILQSSMASISLFTIILVLKPTSILYVGLAFSSIVLLENLLSYIFYEKAKNSRS